MPGCVESIERCVVIWEVREIIPVDNPFKCIIVGIGEYCGNLLAKLHPVAIAQCRGNESCRFLVLGSTYLMHEA